MRYRQVLCIATFIALTAVPGPAQSAGLVQQPQAKVTPAIVEMGTFYGGATVRVEGTTGLGSNVVIAVRGSGKDEAFNKVGRVGPIWVNTGKVTISAVPSVLLVYSSAPLSACLNRPALDSHYLDADALKQQMKIETKVHDTGIADDFLMLKTKRGTYRLTGGGIQMAAPTRDGVPYVLEFRLPRTVPPGTYQMSLLECRNGEVVGNSALSLKVTEIGFPAYIVRLAMQRPAFYGLISVLVAMLAGFGIDFLASRLFKRKVTAH